jgi:spore coat polysaccharide biosynthesis protein SpsF (cytidylyltransferase family)
MGDLDDEKLDNKQFDQYVAAEKESDRVYREANSLVQERIFKAIDVIQTDVKTILRNSGDNEEH